MVLGFLVSIFVLKPISTDVNTHADSILYLDQKSSDIITLSASTTAASAAISLIPIACIFAILYVLLKNQKAGAIAGKLCAFSMVLLLVVPMSVQLSELIDQTYQISLEQNIEDTEELIEDSTEFSEENVQEGSNWLENIGNIISDNLSSLTSGISDLVNKGETLLSDILETIAVMIITACFIPILVFLILFWATKLIIGVEISLPQIKPKRRKQLKGNESLIEYTEIKN